MERDKSAYISIEVNEAGELSKTQFSGNVGSMFSAVGALIAYLIEKHELNANDILNILTASVLAAIELDKKEE